MSPAPSTARAAYLERAYELIRAELMPEAPERRLVALAYSFPSRGARRAAKRGRIGECHYGTLTGSESGERNLIVIHPSEWSEDVRVLAVLGHEMIHAALGKDVGHKPAFAALARRIGLEGPPTCTRAGSTFKRWVEGRRPRLPGFPAGALSLEGRRVQGTRLRLYECACAPPFKVRSGRDDLDAGCKRCGCPFVLRTGTTGARIEGSAPTA